MNLFLKIPNQITSPTNVQIFYLKTRLPLYILGEVLKQPVSFCVF
jgi:hypothetical protein